VVNLEKCSLLVTLPSELNPLRDEEMQTTVQHFIERLQAAHDKICTAMNVVKKRLHFMQRSFAEYFTPRWCSKKIQSNRSFLERIFDPEYGFVRFTFDRMFAKDCLMHYADLEGDMK